MTSSLLNNATPTPEPNKISSPGLNNFSDEPVYNTKAAVRLSGVPAPTLRAWERRYGVLSPERAGNDYRLYSERDVAKIRWLREQVERGISIRQAVALLLRLENQTETELAEEPEPAPSQIIRYTAPAENYETNLSLSGLRQSLMEAFIELDELAAERAIAGAVGVYGVEEVCAGLIEPVLYEIGERWANGELLVTTEHFASAIIRTQLSNLLRTAPLQQHGPLVLAGCAPGEHHEIGLLILTLFMRRQGLRVVYLGQDVPAGDFQKSVEQLRPALVCISCSVVESLGGLLEVARRVEQLPSQYRPTFSFGGRLFQLHPELAERIPGYYLGADAHQAAQRIRELSRQKLD